MYNKTNWKKGDVITPEKLNKIEKALEDAHKAIAQFSKVEKEVGEAKAEQAKKEPVKSVKSNSSK